MKNYYCPECGYKNTYQLDKPRFCGSCGKEMEKVKTARYESKPISKASLSMDDFEIVEDNYQDNSSGYSNSFGKKNPFSSDSVTLSANSPSVQTLGQIKDSGPSPSKLDKFQRPKDIRSKEEILQEFKREASSNRESVEIGG